MDINLVNTSDGDWEALYIDDELVLEGHSLNIYDVLEEVASRLSNTIDINLASMEYPIEKLEKLFNCVMPLNYNELYK